MATIPIPSSMTFKAWVGALTQSLSKNFVPIAPVVSHWRNWAASFISLNVLTQLPVPSKLLYPHDEDWKKWALAIIPFLESL